MRAKAVHRGRSVELIAGAVLVLGMVGVLALGPILDPGDPGKTTPLLHTEGGGFVAPPYRPSPQFPLGSDWAGRDVLRMFLHGGRYTLAIAGSLALARVLIGGTLGLWAWSREGVLNRFIGIGAAVGGALPALALGLAILRMVSGAGLSNAGAAMWFVASMALLGWPRIAVAVARRVQWLLNQPFIEGARAIGCTPRRILRRHILPHLAVLLIVLLALEVSSALILLGQLGVFRAYIGGTEVIEREPFRLYVPISGEWAASLSSARDSLRSAPWIPLVPAAGILWASVAFTLVAEGLKRRFRRAGEW